MAKKPSNQRASWTPQAVRQLKRLAKQKIPTRVIAKTLGRTPKAIAQKAFMESISLGAGRHAPGKRRTRR